MARLSRWAPRALTLVLLAMVAGLGTAEPADAQSADDAGSFQWDDPNMKTAFGACLDQVDLVAGGSAKYNRPPEGVDMDLWKRAVNWDWFMLWDLPGDDNHIPLPWTDFEIPLPNQIPKFRTQQFNYRPHCEVLLPQGYETMVPLRFWTDAFSRCMKNVAFDLDDEKPGNQRPPVVPAWHWEVSMETGQCYLLLPRGAFELGDDGNAWSGWSSADEGDFPTSHENPAVMEAYALCVEYIGWRMEGAATFRGLGSEYDDPPDGSVPNRVWHEALNYYVDPGRLEAGGRNPLEWGPDEVTVPATWFPNCGLLLTNRPCDAAARAKKAIIPDLCLGGHATSQYDIGYSEYDNPEEEGMPSFSRNLWGASTAWSYFIGKSAIQVALWMVDWGYRFNISELNPLAIDIGDKYQSNLVHSPVGERLQDLFWLILISWTGFVALRGKLGVAGGELLVTVVMLLVAAVLINNRDMYMNETWRLMTEASNTLLTAGLKDPASGQVPSQDDLIKDVQARIHRVFVEDTYDYLNWGQPLGDPNDEENLLRACAKSRFRILDLGPHATDKWPRQEMSRAGQGGCESLVEFNRNPTGNRLVGAMLMMVSALAVAILLGLMSLTIVVSKFIALLLFAVAPLAAMMTILPGAGRKLAWSWVSTLVQVLLAVIGMSFLLSLLLLALAAVAGLTNDVPLIERFLVMNLIVFVVFAARRSLLSSGQRLAGRLGEYMSATRGSGTTWAAAGAASVGSGPNLLQIDRATLWTAGAPTAAVGNHLMRRVTERRVAQRSYKNLERVAYWKRRRNTGYNPYNRWRFGGRRPLP